MKISGTLLCMAFTEMASKGHNWQGCAQFRVESTLAHSTQFNFELTFELIFECATL